MQETATFHDQADPWVTSVDSLADPTRDMTDTANVTLAQFMARPVMIYTVDWATTDTNFNGTFNPWDKFLTSPSIVKKISNYNNLRCRLHLKFLINGNAFHYGRVVCSYTPLPNHSDYPLLLPLFKPELIRYTSRPFILLDPNTNQGGEMVLPFFFYNNAMSIPNHDWDNMGIIDLVAMNPLKHAAGAVDKVRITVYAWAEDVHLSTPTSALPTEQLDNQIGDEYTGVVSQPATTVAKISGLLSNVPVIGPFARASQMAASTIAGIASLFGYARPVAIDMQNVRVQYAGNMANTNVVDNSFKLTADVKQEITVDPRTVGLSDVDEMSIVNIATKQSYVFQFPWNVGYATDRRLTTIAVTPVIFDVYDVNHYIFPPCCFAALPFMYWRGTMRYRFQIVASNFHKGRLLVRYDPHIANSTDVSTGFSRIIDISEERDFTIDVGWGVHNNYCETQHPATYAQPFVVGNTLMPNTVWEGISNGFLTVTVLNDLTVPNSEVNNDIAINVYISTGEDIEFQGPNDEYLDAFVFHAPPDPFLTFEELEDNQTQLNVESEHDKVLLENQVGDVINAVDSDQNTTLPSQPIQTESLGTMACIGPVSSIADICFGEKIASFRSLIKRYNLHEIMVFTSPSGSLGDITHYARWSKAFPIPRGKNSNGIHLTHTDTKYNYVHNTLMNYLAVAYAARRGGIRLKFQPLDRSTTSSAPLMQIHHMCSRQYNVLPSEATVIQTEFGAAATTSRVAATISHYETGRAGMMAQDVAAQPILECEIPYYSRYRFSPSQLDSTDAFPEYETGFRYDLVATRRAAVSGYRVMKYVAAGDDFSFFFYIGPPRAFYQPSNPAPKTT
jgi:hypothetical protein